jgi:hypothetical protein
MKKKRKKKKKKNNNNSSSNCANYQEVKHVERMVDSRMPKRVMREKLYTRRKRGRPKVRWQDDVQEDLREMGI